MKSLAMNPYLPLWEYVPDAEPRVFGQRLYVYGSHDFAPGDQGFCPGDYLVWSAPLDDLGRWRCDGVAYPREGAGDGAAPAEFLQAPDVVQGPDGRYYLYYNRARRAECGVAVAGRPEGPFRFLGWVRDADGKPFTGQMLFDPGVLVDGGAVYLYTGFVPGADFPYRIPGMPTHSAFFELEPDMLTIRRGPLPLLPGQEAARGTDFAGHGFYEASSPRKIRGQYVLAYSSEQSHELCYAVSDRPDGGFCYQGTLVSNADLGLDGNTAPQNPFGNTHGGLVQLGADWYVFYHRQTHGIECCRQGCAEKLPLRADGWFGQAEMTSCGLNGGPLPAQGAYNACYCCSLTAPAMTGKRLTTRHCTRDVEPHIFEERTGPREQDARHYLANITGGTAAGFKYFRFDGARQAVLRLRGRAAGAVRLHLDAPDGPAAGSAALAVDGGWTDVAVPLAAAGTHALYAVFDLAPGGALDWEELAFA